MNTQRISYLTLVLLTACGGSISLPTVTKDASADANVTQEAGDASCLSLEGMSCPSGANTCDPCHTPGSEYVCDGMTQTLHLRICSPESSCVQCDQPVPVVDADVCVCLGANFGTWMCGGVQAPDAESCLHCGGHCNSGSDQ